MALHKNRLREMADIVGEDFFSAEPYMTEIYSTDIATLPGIVNDLLETKADAVAQPTSTEIVSNLTKYCVEYEIPMIPRGHGTSGYGGVLPTRSGVVVEMTRMNEVFRIDRDAMTVEVGAGIIWGNLLEILEDERLTVPAYPSSAPSSTVGGWVAAGGTGIGSTRYGGIKDIVVDLEVVLPNGVAIRTSEVSLEMFRDPEKYEYHPSDETYFFSVESPDTHEEQNLTRLFVDSNGSLGIITKVVLKLNELRSIHPYVATFRSRDLMAGALRDILDVTRPFYLHFTNDTTHRMLKELGRAPETTGEWVILAAYEGEESEVEDEVRKMAHVVERWSGKVESEEVADHAWEERFYPMRIKRLGPSLAPSEVYVPIDNLGDFLAHLERHFKRERFATEGAVTNEGKVAVLTWFLDDERKRISFLMGWYRSLDVIAIGVEHGGSAYSIGMWNVSHSRPFYGNNDYRHMSGLKKNTDPKNIANPHKVFTGPLKVSFRLSLLVSLIAAVMAVFVVWLAMDWFPDFFVFLWIEPWLDLRSIWGLITVFSMGLVAGVFIVEIMNNITVSFLLTIGRPILRLGRRIWH
ncbi:MAG: FAD-binding oxidoreductase [Candidatus Thorarchaeota archaeon]